MNGHIMTAFKTALTESITDDMLPMNTSVFTSKHLYPNAPEGIKLDFKKSTFKKISKFLTEQDKAGTVKYG